MTHLEVLVQQTDERVEYLQKFLGSGKATSFEDYKSLCGEIKGLLIARGLVLDLKQNLENDDD
jgi:hypothetical protein